MIQKEYEKILCDSIDAMDRDDYHRGLGLLISLAAANPSKVTKHVADILKKLQKAFHKNNQGRIDEEDDCHNILTCDGPGVMLLAVTSKRAWIRKFRLGWNGTCWARRGHQFRDYVIRTDRVVHPERGSEVDPAHDTTMTFHAFFGQAQQEIHIKGHTSIYMLILSFNSCFCTILIVVVLYMTNPSRKHRTSVH